MHDSVLFGGSIAAALVAGMIALFAPCCLGVMLPAFFASSFQNKGRLIAMTFLFAGGVATIILPIALGAAALLRLINAGHTPLYVAGGLIMLGLGAYTLLGGRIHLPSPGRQAGGGNGPLALYSLGLFSGVASSCCAPVLAGLIALSGLSSSLPTAVALGGAYVTGMVAPLFVISLLWDAFDWRRSPLFRPRTLTWRVGPVSRMLGGTEIASGLLLAVMGVAAIWVGLAVDAMPAPSQWQARLTVGLQSYGKLVTERLAVLPNWVLGSLIAAALALLGLYALKQVGVLGTSRRPASSQPDNKRDIEIGTVREAKEL
jgi:cytochrome c-type biogenesis protein